MKKEIRGNWLIKYDKSINKKNILPFLLHFQDEIKNDYDLIFIELGQDLESKSFIQKDKNILYIKSKDFNSIDINNFIKTNDIKLPKIKTNINSILLTIPYLSNDSRWKDIDVPSSTIFLGSDLTNNNFSIKTKKLSLPFIKSNQLFSSDSDMIAFTLFEDLIDKFIDFLNDFEKKDKFLAAGGPFISLNPLEALQYLDKVNIFLRGEGEFIFSKLIKILNSGKIEDIFNLYGIALSFNNILILSSYHRTNYTYDFENFKFNLNFLNQDFKSNELEMNFSRGCKRGCIFCSKVQGKYFRKLPVEKIDNLLKDFKLIRKSDKPYTININDDDILQDKNYAEEVFKTIIKNKYKLWGIQTSIESFFSNMKEIDYKLINIINNRELFVMDKPLLWLGTDGFSEHRKKTLSKFIPKEKELIKLIEEFEKRDILNYHYWISSDYRTNWESFLNELFLIINLKNRYSNFYLLAHSPFIIPYPSTPIYKILEKISIKSRIKVKKKYENNDKIKLLLVERLETEYENLNKLLLNERDEKGMGFFDYLKEYDFLEALKLSYTYLKKDILLHNDNELINAEKLLYNKISELI